MGVTERLSARDTRTFRRVRRLLCDSRIVLFFRRMLRKRVIDLADSVNDIVVDPLRVFGADADLNEPVENVESLAAAVRPIFDFLALWAVEGRPVRMTGPLIDHGFLHRQQNRTRQRGCGDFSLPQFRDASVARGLIFHFKVNAVADIALRIGAATQSNPRQFLDAVERTKGTRYISSQRLPSLSPQGAVGPVPSSGMTLVYLAGQHLMCL